MKTPIPTEVVTAPEITSTPTITQPLPQVRPREQFVNKNPSDWELRVAYDDVIVGRNSVSGEIFEGTMTAFNEAMR
jgi:hypothetical protein